MAFWLARRVVNIVFVFLLLPIVDIHHTSLSEKVKQRYCLVTDRRTDSVASVKAKIRQTNYINLKVPISS